MRRDLFRIFSAAAIAALASACGSGDIFTTVQPGTGGSGGSGGSTGTASVASLSLIANSAALPTNATDPSSGLSGVTLTAIAVDANNNAVSEATIVFSAVAPAGSTRTGTPVALIVGGTGVTDSSGIVTATVFSGGNTSTGIINVTATAGTLSQTLQINVIPPTSAGGGGTITAAQLNVVVSNSQLASDAVDPADGVDITGILLDANNVAVPGVQATFSTTRGQLVVGNSVSDSSGRVTATLTTGGNTTLGPITVTITAPRTGSTTPLTGSTVINEVAGSSGVAVSRFTFLADSATLAADASSSGDGVTLTVTALDASNNVISGVNVAFSSNGVTVSDPKGALQILNGTTDSAGQAKAVLTTGGDPTLGTIRVTATIGSTSRTLDIQEVAAANPNVAIGSGTGSSFQLGDIAVGAPSISAGGSSALDVDIVDTNSSNAPFVGTNVTLTFNSTCVGQGLATINGSPVTTATGLASVTYVDKGCGSTGGNTDAIFVTGTVNGQTVTAQGAITIAATSIGSMQFVSATPSIIGLKGSGQPENSIVVFKIVNSSGGPIVGQTVNFSLSTTVGGITLGTAGATTDSAVTDASGLVQTQVNAGTVHTSVRVTATAGAFTTQSAKLVISSGNPDQNSFSLSTSCFNVEGLTIDGTTTSLTLRAADHFNNPVPDGTAIAYTTEGGSVEDSCETVNGACTVFWTSQDPRPSNGRSTVLSSALGEETFIDLNGNGRFEDSDTFFDLSEAFRDDDEDGTYDTTDEEFLDFDIDGNFDAADGEYNGSLCSSPGTGDCESPARSLHVRDSLIVIMSGSAPVLENADISGSGFVAGTFNPSGSFTVQGKGSGVARFVIRDVNNQPMPAGTTVVLTASGDGGSVSDPSSFTVPCMNDDSAAANTYSFGILGADEAGSGVLTLTVTSPSGVVATYQFTLNSSAPPACSDGDDNDSDTFTDFPNDPQCTSASDTSEST
jgi:hypothetical protein